MSSGAYVVQPPAMRRTRTAAISAADHQHMRKLGQRTLELMGHGAVALEKVQGWGEAQWAAVDKEVLKDFGKDAVAKLPIAAVTGFTKDPTASTYVSLPPGML